MSCTMFTFQNITCCTVSWLLWRLLRRYLLRTPFDNVAGPSSNSLITGNHFQIFGPEGWEFHQRISDTYGSVSRVHSLLGEKQLYAFDPLALQHIFVKDQTAYDRAPLLIGIGGLILGNGLLNSTGDTHRKQRKMMNPVFSVAHLRHMVPIFYEVIKRVRSTLTAKLLDGPQELEMIQWMSRAALELIGQGGLGVSFDSLSEITEMHPYSICVKELIPTVTPLQAAGVLVFPWGMKLGTPRFRRFIVNTLPWPRLHKARDLIDLMHETSVKIFEAKKRAYQQGDEAVAKQIGRGKDILGILMKDNTEAPEEDRLPEDELIAQMSTMIFAATDTTSGALARLMHLLATHPDVQDKLRKEIMNTRNSHGDLSYDELVNLPYLDAVVRETLRLHPPVTSILRTACKDNILPLSEPITGVNGKPIREIYVPKGTTLIISIISSNRNPAIWGPDAHEWKPERWLNQLPPTLDAAHLPGVYAHLMSFIGGSRACIGFKFSQLEIKITLLLLLETMKIEPSDKTIVWHMNLITNPIVLGEDRPQMPLKFSLI